MREESERRLAVLTIGAIVLIVATAVGPAVVSSRPAYEIPVRTVENGQRFADPTAEAWLTTSAVEVPLESAPSGVPNASDTSVKHLEVRAVRSDTSLYIRVTWADPSPNTSAARPRQFADKVAVELPVNTSTRPPIAMGSVSNPVNVWTWSAATGEEELLAGGPGTTTRFPNSTVSASGEYDDGHWHVVFHRELTVPGENRTDIRLEHDLNVAFAVWNGGNMERAGRKTVSQWYYLPFGPEPEGPPYEAILWIIAGLAVLVVVGVTIEGVRRTHGGEQE